MGHSVRTSCIRDHVRACRYIYIPLGGSKWALINLWPIFVFVALWHDLNLNLLSWGLLIPLFILPELLAGQFAEPWLAKRVPPAWMRRMTALGATFNITLMMLGNLVGFAVGIDGAKQLAELNFGRMGPMKVLICLGWSLAVFYSSAQVMLEVRAEEARHGIHRNY